MQRMAVSRLIVSLGNFHKSLPYIFRIRTLIGGTLLTRELGVY
jgi:hypothetical protein